MGRPAARSLWQACASGSPSSASAWSSSPMHVRANRGCAGSPAMRIGCRASNRAPGRSGQGDRRALARRVPLSLVSAAIGRGICARYAAGRHRSACWPLPSIPVWYCGGAPRGDRAARHAFAASRRQPRPSVPATWPCGRGQAVGADDKVSSSNATSLRISNRSRPNARCIR